MRITKKDLINTILYLVLILLVFIVLTCLYKSNKFVFTKNNTISNTTNNTTNKYSNTVKIDNFNVNNINDIDDIDSEDNMLLSFINNNNNENQEQQINNALQNIKNKDTVNNYISNSVTDYVKAINDGLLP